ERRDEQGGTIGQPGEKEQRRHEGEAERHRDEGLAEARPARDRRQVAVEQPPERELERILGAEQERRDPDLKRRDGSDSGQEVEALLSPRRQRSAQDEDAKSEPSDEQREREEVRPADDVLGCRGPRRSVRLGRRWRGIADAEREDAGDDVAVTR